MYLTTLNNRQLESLFDSLTCVIASISYSSYGRAPNSCDGDLERWEALLEHIPYILCGFDSELLLLQEEYDLIEHYIFDNLKTCVPKEELLDYLQTRIWSLKQQFKLHPHHWKISDHYDDDSECEILVRLVRTNEIKTDTASIYKIIKSNHE